ncbi:MAG: DUF3857 domain-containing protein [Planctomycetota bacterium]
MKSLIAWPLLLLAVAAPGDDLPTRAQRLADGGQPLAAWQLLADAIAKPWPAANDESGGADESAAWQAAQAEIAALQFQALTETLDAAPEALALLEASATLLADWPPAAAFRLGSVRAGALRAAGRFDEARAVYAELGACRDVLVMGPFDNERGSGLHSAYPPEVSIDLEAAVPGKERPVRWRKHPCPERGPSRLILDGMLRPDEQAVAYLATALRSERGAAGESGAPGERDVVLRLGSSGAFKVFLNGRELLARDVERPHRADQDRVVLRLIPGWNQLLVKSCVETGNWSLELRLTELDGRPATDLVVDSAQVRTPEPSETTASGAPAALGAPAPEAREILTKLIETRSARGDTAGAADAARLLALYHLSVHPDDRVTRSARSAAERALQLQPDNVDALYLLARSNEPEGASREEMEVNRRLQALQDVLQRDPQHVGALLDLASFSMRESPQPARADQLSSRALAQVPDSWRALMLRASFLSGRGRSAEQEALQERALASPEAELRQEALRLKAERLLRQGRPAEAEALLRRAVTRAAQDPDTAGALMNLLFERERPLEALEVARQLQRAVPFAIGPLRQVAERLAFAGLAAEARGLLDELLVISPEDDRTLLVAATLHERVGEVDAAQSVLAEVVRLDPGNTNARRHREILAADGERERFEDPWRRDAVALAGGTAPASDEGEPIEVLERTTVWRVNPDGTEHVYEHLVLRVLNQGGVRQLDTISLPTGEGRPHIHTVRVIRPDGSFTRAPSSGGRSYFDLPALRPGDLVDLEYRVDQREADVFGEYFGLRHNFYADLFDGWLPTRHAELVVVVPADLPLHAVERNGAGLERSERTDESGLRVLSWVARDLPRPPVESRMPGRTELAPVVDLTTFRDWDAFARWWWSFIQKEFVTTPAMREKVAELTAGLESEEDRVEAIARFVGQDIRYNSWPFGTHGYEPFSAATIFERRFGDCKDKSILLRQLLAEIGVEAVPVLIQAEWERADEPLEAAMVGHFNHCIAYVTPTADRPGYYLDATADRNPVEYLRADDQGARVLHVTPQGGELHDIPYAPPEENALRRHYTVRLTPQGDGEVTLSDRSNGHFAVMLRSRYGGESGDARKSLARELSGAFGAVDVLALHLSDLEDIGEPSRLDVTFLAKGLWTAEGGLRTLRPGFDELGLEGVAAEPEGQRRFDLVLDRPFLQETNVHWILPAGSRPAALPRDVLIEGPGLLRYSQTVRAVDDGLEVLRRFELLTRRVQVAEYGNFRRLLREVELAEERSIAIEPPSTERER